MGQDNQKTFEGQGVEKFKLAGNGSLLNGLHGLI